MDTSSFDIVGLCIEAGIGLLIFSLFVGLSMPLLLGCLLPLYAFLTGKDLLYEETADGYTHIRVSPAKTNKESKAAKDS